MPLLLLVPLPVCGEAANQKQEQEKVVQTGLGRMLSEPGRQGGNKGLTPITQPRTFGPVLLV